MRVHPACITLLTFLVSAAAAGCDSTGDGGGSGGSAGAGGSPGAGTGGTGPLRWVPTCGDPVCGGHTADPAVPPCTTETLNAPCTTAGATCDPVNDCNAHLVCATADPTQQPGGCPISRAQYKHDIRYLPDAELARVRDEIVGMPLATWRYNHEGAAGPEHLGFLIDDDPSSPAVTRDGTHVDLYGYTSMAVAAIQVQQRQIAALEQEIAALRKELAAQRPAAPHPAARRPPAR